MLELSALREQRDEVIRRLAVKNVVQPEAAVDRILELDEQRRSAILRLEQSRAELNQLSKSIGQLMAAGDKTAADRAKNRTGELKNDIRTFEERLTAIEEQVHQHLVALPNCPDPSVPAGRTPEDNHVVYQNNISHPIPANAKPHWELCESLDIIDFQLGVKITGAGFPVYKGKGAILQRALIRFFLEQAEAEGYLEIQPPLMVNRDSGYGTGQLPDKDGQMYHASEDDLYLIPTAEVPITNLYRDVILEESQFPIKNCGYSQCFRREAGSYGKDVRGLNRLHQFDKVEIVQVTRPEDSYATLESMRTYVQGLLEKIGLQYRVLLLCGGDMSFASAKTYDMEVWSAAQQRWLEVSSVSNFETFQANRLKLRYRDSERRTRLAHTLNGSALALPRIVAAILENFQDADGSVRIPEALRPYTRFDRIG